MTTRLENWCVVNKDPLHYVVPERSGQNNCLHGIVTGHSRLPDGTTITTSTIVGKKGHLICTFRGSRYELGKIDQTFSAGCPGARERLIVFLKEIRE